MIQIYSMYIQCIFNVTKSVRSSPWIRPVTRSADPRLGRRSIHCLFVVEAYCQGNILRELWPMSVKSTANRVPRALCGKSRYFRSWNPVLPIWKKKHLSKDVIDVHRLMLNPVSELRNPQSRSPVEWTTWLRNTSDLYAQFKTKGPAAEKS